MDNAILRPVVLRSGLIGQPAPCDLFDVRGTLLLREGAEIRSVMASGAGERRLYCRAEQAEKVSDADPLGRLREIGNALAMLDELLVGGHAVGADEFISLADTTYDVWIMDPDACIGFARMAHYDRPSVCHAILAALFAAELAAAHGFTRQESIALIGAALTMNLGSLRLHDRTFAHLGPLDAAMRDEIDAHPELAASLLEQLGGFPDAWVVAVRQHHENFDGSGYPRGLSRTDISLAARMLRVADVLAARLRERRRRGPLFWSLHHARTPERLLEHVFGPDLERLDHILARLLMSRLGSFPPGSVVRLSSGEMGIISRRSNDADGVPREALAFLDIHGRPQHAPRPRRIGPRDCRIQGYAHDDQPRLPPYDWHSIWGYKVGMPKPKLM